MDLTRYYSAMLKGSHRRWRCFGDTSMGVIGLRYLGRIICKQENRLATKRNLP